MDNMDRYARIQVLRRIIEDDTGRYSDQEKLQARHAMIELLTEESNRGSAPSRAPAQNYDHLPWKDPVVQKRAEDFQRGFVSGPEYFQKLKKFFSGEDKKPGEKK